MWAAHMGRLIRPITDVPEERSGAYGGMAIDRRSRSRRAALSISMMALLLVTRNPFTCKGSVHQRCPFASCPHVPLLLAVAAPLRQLISLEASDRAFARKPSLTVTHSWHAGRSSEPHGSQWTGISEEGICHGRPRLHRTFGSADSAVSMAASLAEIDRELLYGPTGMERAASERALASYASLGPQAPHAEFMVRLSHAGEMTNALCFSVRQRFCVVTFTLLTAMHMRYMHHGISTAMSQLLSITLFRVHRQAPDMAERGHGWLQTSDTYAPAASPSKLHLHSAADAHAQLRDWAAGHALAPGSECHVADSDRRYGDWHADTWDHHRGPPAATHGHDGGAPAVMDHQVFSVRPDDPPAEYLGWGRIDKPPRPAAPTFGCSSRGPPPSMPYHARCDRLLAVLHQAKLYAMRRPMQTCTFAVLLCWANVYLLPLVLCNSTNNQAEPRSGQLTCRELAEIRLH